jgi:hypothetical protein
MGTEIGCKSWLSGGRLVCNKRTWFAHMFRTQGQDFGFPYSLTVGAQRRARKYSQDLWLNNRWSRATRPFSWIMDHFKPVKDWEDWKGGDASDGSPLLGTTDIPSATEPCPVASEEAGQGSIAPAVVTPKVSRGIIYYSDCRPSPDLLRVCHEQLLRAGADLPLVGVTLGKPPFALNGCGEYIFKAWSRGILTMFRQILEGLEALDTDIAFLCEHDLLYHPSHFSFTPEKRDVFYYNENTFKVDFHSGQALFYYTKQTSGLCADRKLLVEHYHRRIAKVVQNQRDLETQGLPVRRDGFSRHMGFEPGCHRPPRGVDHYPALRWMSEQPNIDIRHDHNLTPSRWSQDKFRSKNSCQGWKMTDEVPGWGRTKGRFSEFLKEVADGRRSFSK